MSYILHIETSSRTCSVSIGKEGLVISTAEDNDQFDHARVLSGLIAQVVDDAGIQLNQLEAIAVSEGPGSYTGLRIGTATAKGLCYALQIPLLGIPTLQMLAVELIANKPCYEHYTVLLPSRKGEIYIATYGPKLDTLVAPCCIHLQELEKYLSDYNGILGISNSITDAEIYDTCKKWSQTTVTHSSKNMAALAYESHQFKAHKSLIYFEPLYLKGVYISGRST